MRANKPETAVQSSTSFFSWNHMVDCFIEVNSLLIFTHTPTRCRVQLYTVEPPNKGHYGANDFVPCREVVLISEVK